MWSLGFTLALQIVPDEFVKSDDSLLCAQFHGWRAPQISSWHYPSTPYTSHSWIWCCHDHRVKSSRSQQSLTLIVMTCKTGRRDLFKQQSKCGVRVKLFTLRVVPQFLCARSHPWRSSMVPVRSLCGIPVNLYTLCSWFYCRSPHKFLQKSATIPSFSLQRVARRAVGILLSRTTNYGVRVYSSTLQVVLDEFVQSVS